MSEARLRQKLVQAGYREVDVMYNVSICLAMCGHVGVATQASGVLFITPRGTCVRARAGRVSRMLLVDSSGRV